jgi:signal transduction histidine kinase
MISEVDRIAHVLCGTVQTALLNLQALAVTMEHDAAAQESIGLIRDEMLRGGRMLVAAFDVLSIELGEMQRVNLRTLVRRALETHGVDHVVVAPGVWPEVRVDERLLALAIAHLARNARAATPPDTRGPEIRARARRDGEVEIVVRDWGRGFDGVKPPGRAFGSARQDHAATGLLTTERIARLHGGRLSFASSRRGTEVRLSIPETTQPRRPVPARAQPRRPLPTHRAS